MRFQWGQLLLLVSSAGIMSSALGFPVARQDNASEGYALVPRSMQSGGRAENSRTAQTGGPDKIQQPKKDRTTMKVRVPQSPRELQRIIHKVNVPASKDEYLAMIEQIYAPKMAGLKGSKLKKVQKKIWQLNFDHWEDINRVSARWGDHHIPFEQQKHLGNLQRKVAKWPQY